jgi:quinolinate synthase
MFTAKKIREYSERFKFNYVSSIVENITEEIHNYVRTYPFSTEHNFCYDHYINNLPEIINQLEKLGYEVSIKEDKNEASYLRFKTILSVSWAEKE